jgi:hypothetical protein
VVERLVDLVPVGEALVVFEVLAQLLQLMLAHLFGKVHPVLGGGGQGGEGEEEGGKRQETGGRRREERGERKEDRGERKENGGRRDEGRGRQEEGGRREEGGGRRADGAGRRKEQGGARSKEQGRWGGLSGLIAYSILGRRDYSSYCHYSRQKKMRSSP